MKKVRPMRHLRASSYWTNQEKIARWFFAGNNFLFFGRNRPIVFNGCNLKFPPFLSDGLHFTLLASVRVPRHDFSQDWRMNGKTFFGSMANNHQRLFYEAMIGTPSPPPKKKGLVECSSSRKPGNKYWRGTRPSTREKKKPSFHTRKIDSNQEKAKMKQQARSIDSGDFFLLFSPFKKK